ncbi:unnamed protein product [Nippostrongylus brasiliensis]|uniref:Carboxylic ester hydrolase n=1 Tax=Nippostrongylus brasiliensis TaxID=27835 RepID=A0A0N4YBB2_NIPBR|nr:unnamed protein product [Nippostrongylus brasiliensis]
MMSRITATLAVVSVLLLVSVRSIRIKSTYGELEGYQTKSSSGKIVNVFKRVPYAAPPVGGLRFKKPQPPLTWSGTWNATEYGPACMSNSSTTTSPQKWVDEDCLHVNIFAGADCMEKACPVVFYIHGSGFNYDSAVMFKDEYLINNFGANGIAMVIPGVRLGFFGLLTFDNDDVVPRNLAAYDLLAALQFVKQEIGNFGGDPDDVTLFGHSGGATAATQFAFSKSVDPDVNVMMSMSMHFANETLMRELTMDLAHRAKCLPSHTSMSSAEKITECLRNLGGSEILRIQREMEEEDVDRRPEGFVMTPPLFEADNLQTFLDNPPARSIMIGTTAAEFDNSKKNTEDKIVTLLGLKNAAAVVARYREDHQEGRLGFNHTTETQLMFLSTYLVAYSIRSGGGKAFLYSYENKRHAVHTDDLSYVMGVHEFERDPNEKVLAVIYPLLFTNFIKSGKPRQDWTPLMKGVDNYMYIDVNVFNSTWPHMAQHYNGDVISYWESMQQFDEAMSKGAVEVDALRDVTAYDYAAEDTLNLLLVFLPLITVICTVFVVNFIVRRHQQMRSHLSEKTPLLITIK